MLLAVSHRVSISAESHTAGMSEDENSSRNAILCADNTDSRHVGFKRKRQAEAKFYAVRSGHCPGIYHSWPECLAQVKGFKSAICTF